MSLGIVERDVHCEARTPLPKLQLFIVLLVQAAEPICGTVIFPFINQWVRETGVTQGDEAKTGYYAGIIGSAFFVAECITVLFWSRASDRFGRKPILLLGTIGLSVSMFTAGLSTHYAPLLLSRAAQGMFNGNIGVCKNVMAEISDPTNIAEAFAFIPFMWTAGLSIGPLLGGVLARPAKRWPDTLGKLNFLRSHPYFLPCGMAGMFSVFAFAVAAFYLKETLPSLVERRKHASLKTRPLSSLFAFRRSYNNYSAIPTSTAGTSDAARQLHQKSPPIRDALVRPVVLSLVNFAFQAFVSQSWHVLLPLMYSTSISLGGLDLDAPQIGSILAVVGFCAGILQLLVFGRSVRRFGARRVLQVSFGTFLVSIGLFPVLNYFAKQAGGVDGTVMCLMTVQLIAYMVTAMSYGSNSIFIINAAPSKESLATVNGLAQFVGSTMRSLGPTFTASLFSVSLERQLLGGHMVYVILWGIILLGLYAAFKLPEDTRAGSS